MVQGRRQVETSQLDLTDEQLRMAALTAQGWPQREIAAALGYTYFTLKSRLNDLAVQLGARDSVHIVAMVCRAGVDVLSVPAPISLGMAQVLAEQTERDPYGNEFGDWEDPQGHDMCTGCIICRPWEGRPYRLIRNERSATVARRRAAQAAAQYD
jgi:DNA-binding CsgD family transcriptional regulator